MVSKNVGLNAKLLLDIKQYEENAKRAGKVTGKMGNDMRKVNRGGLRSLNRGLLEASRGVEDFVSQFGTQGFAGGMRAAGNNISQMAFVMGGPLVGALAGFATAAVSSWAVFNAGADEAIKKQSIVNDLITKGEKLFAARAKAAKQQGALAAAGGGDITTSVVQLRKQLTRAKADLVFARGKVGQFGVRLALARERKSGLEPGGPDSERKGLRRFVALRRGFRDKKDTDGKVFETAEEQHRLSQAQRQGTSFTQTDLEITNEDRNQFKQQKRVTDELIKKLKSEIKAFSGTTTTDPKTGKKTKTKGLESIAEDLIESIEDKLEVTKKSTLFGISDQGQASSDRIEKLRKTLAKKSKLTKLPSGASFSSANIQSRLARQQSGRGGAEETQEKILKAIEDEKRILREIERKLAQVANF